MSVPEDQKGHSRRWLLLLLKLAISVGLLIWLAQRVSLAESWQMLLRARPVSVLGALALLGLSLLISSWRWHLAAQCRIPVAACVRFTWIAHFYALVLPGALSADVVKGFLMAGRKQTVTRAELAASIVLDRLAGLGSLLVLGLASALILPIPHRAWLATGAVLAGAGLVFTPWLLKRMLPLLAKCTTLRNFGEFVVSVPHAVWLRVLALSVLIHGVNVSFYWLTLNAVGGTESWWRMALYTCLLNLALLLPVTIAGVGLREHLSLEFLHGTADSSLAIAFSLLILLVSVAHGILGLFCQWLPHRPAAPPR